MGLWPSPSTAPRPLVAVRSSNPFVGKPECQGTNLGGLAHGSGMVSLKQTEVRPQHSL